MASNEVAVKGKNAGNLLFEDVRIVFRNFSGKEGQYNREGDRNFSLILDQDIADRMAADGWNIKYLRPREDGDSPQAYIQVAIKFTEFRPPRVVLITSRGRTEIGEEEVNILDWADFRQIDLIIRPYEWSVNGKSGIKAYLKTIFATIEEDALEQKYANVPDSAQNSLQITGPLAIEAADDSIYAEFTED